MTLWRRRKKLGGLQRSSDTSQRGEQPKIQPLSPAPPECQVMAEAVPPHTCNLPDIRSLPLHTFVRCPECQQEWELQDIGWTDRQVLWWKVSTVRLVSDVK